MGEIQDSQVDSYSYDAFSHHLETITNGGTQFFEYDAAGNTVDNTHHQFVYGDRNRLQEVQVNAFPVATYVYNGRGERVKKDSGGISYYYYDQSGQLLAERDGAGETRVEYVYRDGAPLALLEGGMMIAPPAAEARVNQTVISSQVDPEAAPLTDGTYVVVWRAGGQQDGSGDGIYARRYARGGVALGGEFPVNVTTQGHQRAPRAAALTAGGFVVGYLSGSSVLGRRFDGSAGIGVRSCKATLMAL